MPTGLVLDVPEGYQVLLFSRSGSSGKKHLRLSNGVGVIDEDYTNQVMLLITNCSEKRQVICHGDRLAQAQIVPVYRAIFDYKKSVVSQKTDRVGGLGHTGISVK